MHTRHALLLIALLVVFTPAINSDEPIPTETGRKETIELIVDYGDGAQKRFPHAPWKQGQTALDALVWASKHPHGIELKYRGKNSLAMVYQIDDLKNGGGNKQNWIFYVNSKLSDRGCGAVKLEKGDRILWRYEVYR